MGIQEPDKLPDEEYYKAYADYLFLQKNKRDFYLNILREVALEIFGGEQSL